MKRRESRETGNGRRGRRRVRKEKVRGRKNKEVRKIKRRSGEREGEKETEGPVRRCEGVQAEVTGTFSPGQM